MRKLSVLLISVWCGTLVPSAAQAQDPAAGVIFFQYRQFRIPFNDTKGNVKQVKLYVSTDQGQTWKLTSTAMPEEKHFRFSAAQDGFYCFDVQTIDDQGNALPPGVDKLQTNLKVIVDTLAPTVRVQPLPARQTEVGVNWTIQDDNLDTALPDAVRVEYRIVGAANWVPLAVQAGASQIYWAPNTGAQVEVRVRARDRAGNIGENTTHVSLGGGGGQVPNFANPIGTDDLKSLDRKFVNSKKIALSYDIKDVGPSGVSVIELWYTHYKGRSWTKLGQHETNDSQKLPFEVTDEGIYGISLIAKSGVGLGERPPHPGEKPQFWIEVDITKPVVQILDVHVGHGVDKGKLTVGWNARDKNFGSHPIRLSFAEDREGPWKTVADRLANTGKHVWKMPDGLPFQFYLRIEAVDLAGNVGEAVTFDKIKVDLSLPKARPLDVGPAGP
ncbi:MAG: hypothetical protein HY289_14660 [Planctomycetes bacterium]|nr:hypothetical protein [Planctomycetota bacterium]